MIYKDGKKTTVISVNMKTGEIVIKYEDGTTEETVSGALHADNGVNEVGGAIADAEVSQRQKEQQDFLHGKVWCWYIPHGTDYDGQFIPSIVIENEPGHFPDKNWKWGKDYKIACKAAQQINERRGISEQEAQRIVDSSILASIRKHGLY